MRVALCFATCELRCVLLHVSCAVLCYMGVDLFCYMGVATLFLFNKVFYTTTLQIGAIYCSVFTDFFRLQGASSSVVNP